MFINGLCGLGMGGDIAILLSALTTDLNVFTAAGSPTGPVDVTLTIDSGVIIGGVSGAAINSSGLPSGSTLRIINNGIIVGKSGQMGAGGPGSGPGYGAYGTAGGTGGDAINLGCNIIIDNTNGYIYAGGGGGGGGSSGVPNGGNGGYGRGFQYDELIGGECQGEAGFPYTYYGCPGGAAASGWGGYGGNRPDSPCTYGSGGGGNGGDYGGSGGYGGLGGYNGVPGINGGGPGLAIKRNGYSITWLGGENATQVKGSYA